MRYKVHCTRVKVEGWYRSTDNAIAAFERQCKRDGVEPPLQYPPGLSGDCFRGNRVAYPHRTSAAGRRDGHGCVYIDAANGKPR